MMVADLFDVAQMSRAEVAQYNRRAHTVGRHMCPTCLREFDWTEENFYRQGYSRRGKLLLHTDCRKCELEERKTVLKERYHTDEAFRMRVREHQRAVRAAEDEDAKARRRIKNRQYNQKYEETKRRKKPFDAATLDQVDLQAIGYWDVVWMNHTLKAEGRRVCVDCRAVLRLTVVNFRVYGKRRGSFKAYQMHVCRACEKARRTN
jgi:hypothetical protein